MSIEIKLVIDGNHDNRHPEYNVVIDAYSIINDGIYILPISSSPSEFASYADKLIAKIDAMKKDVSNHYKVWLNNH